MPGQRTAPAYQRVARERVRHVHARNPYAHHIRSLSAALRAMAPDLEVPVGGRVLDYGCAEMPYRSLFADDVDYVGADLSGNERAQVELNEDGTLPLSAGTFDAVISTQVLEHVGDPGLYLAECFRLLVPGGRLLLSTHGVFPYHPDPVDYWRWTGEGLRVAVEEAGFEVVRFEGVIGLAATGLQLLQDAVSYRLPHRWKGTLVRVMQPLVAFADRFETPESLGYNAQVFALIAARPH